jgi:hypothetical protein
MKIEHPKPKRLAYGDYYPKSDSVMSKAIAAINNIASKKKQIVRNIGGFKALKGLQPLMPGLQDAFGDEQLVLLTYIEKCAETMLREHAEPKLIVLGGWNHLVLGECEGLRLMCGYVKVERDKFEGSDGDPDHYFCHGEGYMETRTLTKLRLLTDDTQR